MSIRNTMVEGYQKVTPEDSPDITLEQYHIACRIAATLREVIVGTKEMFASRALDPGLAQPSEVWTAPDGTPVNGSLTSLNQILQPTYDYVNHLRLASFMFSGYNLSNVFAETPTRSWTDDIAGYVPPHYLKGAPDWSVGAFLEMTGKLPNALICRPPILLGESGWRVKGGVVNRDVLSYQERIALLNTLGVIDELKRRHDVRILEIGGGYGGLAYFLKKILPNASYMICDLPSSLTFSATYLALTCGYEDDLIYTGKERDALFQPRSGFTFVPNFLFEDLTAQPFDLVINTMSFAEMTSSAVEAYACGAAKILGKQGFLFEQNFDNSHYQQGNFCNPKPILARHFQYKWDAHMPTRWGQPNLWMNSPNPFTPRETALPVSPPADACDVIATRTPPNQETLRREISNHAGDSTLDVTHEAKALYDALTDIRAEVTRVQSQVDTLIARVGDLLARPVTVHAQEASVLDAATNPPDAPVATTALPIQTDARPEEAQAPPWRTMSVTLPEVNPIKSMICEDESLFLHWLARTQYTGAGEIIDGGPLMGGSSYALASGLEKNATVAQKRHRIHSYDLWIYFEGFSTDLHNSVLGETNLRVGDSLLPLFQENTKRYRDYIEPIQGDILRSKWNGRPVEILFIDCAKSWEIHNHIVQQFFGCLIPNRSVVIQQDYHHYYCYWIHLMMAFFAPYFERIKGVGGATVAFRLTSPIPKELLTRDYSRFFDHDTACHLMDLAIEATEDRMKVFVQTAKLRMLVDRQAYTEALSLAESLRAAPDWWDLALYDVTLAEAEIPSYLLYPGIVDVTKIVGVSRSAVVCHDGDRFYAVPRTMSHFDISVPQDRSHPKVVSAATWEELHMSFGEAIEPTSVRPAIRPRSIVPGNMDIQNAPDVDTLHNASTTPIVAVVREPIGEKALYFCDLQQGVQAAQRELVGLTARPQLADLVAANAITVLSLGERNAIGPSFAVVDVVNPDPDVIQTLVARNFTTVVMPYRNRLFSRGVSLVRFALQFAKRLMILFPDNTVRVYENEGAHRLLYNTAYLDNMFRYIPRPVEGEVLEVGCSDGMVCDLMLKEGPSSIVGIDLLDNVGCNFPDPRISYARMDATAMTFASGRFDCAYSIATMEHVADPFQALLEMRRVLKRGGYGYVQAGPFYHSPFGHHMFGLFDSLPWIHIRRSKEEIIALGRETGVAARILQERGQDIETYVQGMINPLHINGLLYNQYRLEEFMALPDVETLFFARSYEGRELLTPAIRAELPQYSEDDLTAHGFELMFRIR